jgi:regulator of RNase E activity RraA
MSPWNKLRNQRSNVQQQLQILLEAGTAVVADVFDSFGKLPPVLDNSIRPVGPGMHSFIGPAYTVTGRSEIFTGGDRAKLAAIDEMPSGIVALWAGMDVSGVCLFGDLLASAMRSRGCVGAVVDGGVRDVAFLRECGLPVYARYFSPAQGIGRWRVTAAQVPVEVRGALQDWITVAPEDIVAADEDGIIAIPQAMVAVVVARVQEWSAAETAARDEIQNGLPLLDALAKYGHL